MQKSICSFKLSELAEQFGAHAVALRDLPDVLHKADILPAISWIKTLRFFLCRCWLFCGLIYFSPHDTFLLNRVSFCEAICGAEQISLSDPDADTFHG